MSVGIGQGYVTATPLQLVQLAARIASGKLSLYVYVAFGENRGQMRGEPMKLDFSDDTLAKGQAWHETEVAE